MIHALTSKFPPNPHTNPRHCTLRESATSTVSAGRTAQFGDWHDIIFTLTLAGLKLISELGALRPESSESMNKNKLQNGASP